MKLEDMGIFKKLKEVKELKKLANGTNEEIGKTLAPVPPTTKKEKYEWKKDGQPLNQIDIDSSLN